MIRLRVSTLEDFRIVLEEPYGDEARLVERLRRGQWADDQDGNWKTEAGTAWHAILADPVRHQQIDFDGYGSPVTVYRHDSPLGQHSYAAEDVRRALAVVGPGVCEVTGRKTFDVGGRLVQVEGTADRIRGLHVRDAKCKWDGPDASDYERSLQWRFYCLIHGAAAFTYDCFRFKEPTEDGWFELRDVASFSFYPYRGMEADLRGWLARFMDFVHDRRLVKYLTPSTEKAA